MFERLHLSWLTLVSFGTNVTSVCSLSQAVWLGNKIAVPKKWTTSTCLRNILAAPGYFKRWKHDFPQNRLARVAGKGTALWTPQRAKLVCFFVENVLQKYLTWFWIRRSACTIEEGLWYTQKFFILPYRKRGFTKDTSCWWHHPARNLPTWWNNAWTMTPIRDHSSEQLWGTSINWRNKVRNVFASLIWGDPLYLAKLDTKVGFYALTEISSDEAWELCKCCVWCYW